MEQQVARAAAACPACGQVSEGHFCFACGENLHPQRASLKNIAQSIPDIFFDIHSGLFYTLRQLIFHPATTIRNFFDGDRSRHMNPLKFLLYMSAMYAFLYMYFDIQGTSEMYEGTGDAVNEKLLNEQFIKCQSFINVFSLPFLSLCTWLIFGPSRRYYGEHLLLNSYLIGFALFFQIIIFPISLLRNGTSWVDATDYLSLILVFIWCTRTYYGLFHTPSTSNWLFAFLKTTAVIILLSIFQYVTSPLVITLKLLVFGD
jgi:hypothetical protein